MYNNQPKDKVMLNITHAASSASLELIEGAAITVTGTTAKERQLNIVQQGLTRAAAGALVNMKGDVGKAIRSGIEQDDHIRAATLAANGRYLSIIQIYAMNTGNSIEITGPDDLCSMPFTIKQLMESEFKKKNGGKKVDNKTGLTVDVPAVAKLRAMHGMFVEAVSQYKAVKAANEARRTAQNPQIA